MWWDSKNDAMVYGMQEIHCLGASRDYNTQTTCHMDTQRMEMSKQIRKELDHLAGGRPLE